MKPFSYTNFFSDFSKPKKKVLYIRIIQEDLSLALHEFIY